MDATPRRPIGLPVKIGLLFAAIAIILSVVGVIRNPDTPVTAQTLLIAAVVSGLTWGLISWAISAAVIDVEEEIDARDDALLD
ncbi:MAG: hypothetical protein KDD73_07910 [Anaerolineales bacterium]|nr:hypothetical protein [Anaerolineales bacterium]MCB9127167.1 hypothetical protein [Ardenticatenales bacterium]MCB9171927.1 hypothetical protein [Ardenticatenales bacterium]